MTSVARPRLLATAFALLGIMCFGLPAAVSPILPDADSTMITSPAPRTPSPPAADRDAVLAMVGEFSVSFSFRETVPLAPGYARTEPHESGAQEVVLLVEDRGDLIVLQHLLVSPGGHVTKHWRQDWIYDADERFEFVDEQRWELRPIPPHLRDGSWTQCVYEVSDAPRYCGTGRWIHRYGVATWTSDRSWRPLPRREYTQRDDYNALNVENRHTITPHGWTHEQDNTKVRRELTSNGDVTLETLVREFGFNEYRETDTFDFTPAYEYWEATAEFWAEVRARWNELLEGGGLEMRTEVDGMPVIADLFRLADDVRQGEPLNGTSIEAVFTEYIQPVAVPSCAPFPHGPSGRYLPEAGEKT